jgi:hypothetical protein
MYLRYTAFIVYGVTAVVGTYGVVVHPGQVRVEEIWFALILCVVSASMVLGAVWVVLNEAWWRPVVGLILLVPSVIIWGGILLIAYAGFRLH